MTARYMTSKALRVTALNTDEHHFCPNLSKLTLECRPKLKHLFELVDSRTKLPNDRGSKDKFLVRSCESRSQECFFRVFDWVDADGLRATLAGYRDIINEKV